MVLPCGRLGTDRRLCIFRWRRLHGLRTERIPRKKSNAWCRRHNRLHRLFQGVRDGLQHNWTGTCRYRFLWTVLFDEPDEPQVTRVLQCSRVLGQYKGVCRDDMVGGMDNNQLFTSTREDGINIVTYRRTLISCRFYIWVIFIIRGDKDDNVCPLSAFRVRSKWLGGLHLIQTSFCKVVLRERSEN